MTWAPVETLTTGKACLDEACRIINAIPVGDSFVVCTCVRAPVDLLAFPFSSLVLTACVAFLLPFSLVPFNGPSVRPKRQISCHAKIGLRQVDA